MTEPIYDDDDAAVRARHGASTRQRWLRSMKKPYSPMPGAFGVGGAAAVRVAALYPAIVVTAICVLVHGGVALLLLMPYMFVATVPAWLLGGLIGRYLSRFSGVDSPRRTTAQGALLGMAAGLLLALPLAPRIAHSPWRDPTVVAVWILCTAALSGIGAGRAVARWNGS